MKQDARQLRWFGRVSAAGATLLMLMLAGYFGGLYVATRTGLSWLPWALTLLGLVLGALPFIGVVREAKEMMRDDAQARKVHHHDADDRAN